MKIKITKKKLIIYAILIFLISLAGSLFFLYFENLSKYEIYSAYGTVSEEYDSRELEIKAFLKSIEGKGNEYCLNFVSMTEDLEKFNICINKGVLNWENPYEDYSKLIPVRVVLYLDKGIFNIFSFREVNIALLEDNEFMDFIYDMDEEQIQNFQVRIKSNEEIISKGYSYQDIEEQDLVVITIQNSSINEINFDKEKIKINFNSIVLGEEVSVEASVRELHFVTINSQQESIMSIISEENVNMIRLRESCLITFKIEGGNSADEYVAEKFLNQDRYSELNLESIYIFQEQSNED